MRDSQGYYFFRYSCHSDELQPPIDYLVIFWGGGAIDLMDLSQVIDNAVSEAQVSPDLLLLLVPEPFLEELMVEAKNESSELYFALERCPNMVAKIFGSYNHRGEVTSAKVASGKYSAPKRLLIEQIENIKEKGLATIVKRTGALSAAPAGFLYSKPSSRKSNYFIRAENTLQEYEYTIFIAFTLLNKIPPTSATSNGLPKVIYVDTMAIASIAYAMARLISINLGTLYSPTIASFHSYEGLESKNFYYQLQSFCIISASTSCGLSKAWLDYTRCAYTDVITLLSFLQDSAGLRVLHTLEIPSNYESFEEDEDNHGKKQVRIFGEYFYFQPASPRRVEIALRHAPNDFRSKIKTLSGQGLFICNKKSDSASKALPLYVDREKLINTADFQAWLKARVTYDVPASTSHIIYQEDAESKKMAEALHSRLASLNLSLPYPISSDDLASLDARGALLIISAAVGKGRKLLALNRILRSLHEGLPRTYLVGSIIGESEKNIRILKSNLIQTPQSTPNYNIHVYLEDAVGSSPTGNIWNREERWLNTIPVNRRSPCIEARLHDLRRIGDGLFQNAFWCNDVRQGAHLKLRGGFAFADRSLNVGTVSCSDMYFIIARILQYARDHDYPDPEHSLRSDELQQVVISPITFSRYDDGIIQSAILRSALDSELDYRDDSAMSEEMAEFIEAIARGVGKNSGEALTEFLIALGTGRLRLQKTVQRDVLSAISNIRYLPEHASTLISHLLGLYS